MRRYFRGNSADNWAAWARVDMYTKNNLVPTRPRESTVQKIYTLKEVKGPPLSLSLIMAPYVLESWNKNDERSIGRMVNYLIYLLGV